MADKHKDKFGKELEVGDFVIHYNYGADVHVIRGFGSSVLTIGVKNDGEVGWKDNTVGARSGVMKISQEMLPFFTNDNNLKITGLLRLRDSILDGTYQKKNK
jgi:hypothetical protein